jgi:hypothetical protein
LTADEMWQQMTPTTTGIPVQTWHTEISLAGVTPVSLADDVLTLRAGDARNLEMLQGRLRIPLERAASAIARREIQVAFTLNGHAPKATEPAPKPETQETPAKQEPQQPDEAASDPVIELARLDVRRGHWIKQARYIALYWHPYFCLRSRFAGARALAVWQWLRDQFDANKGEAYWTPIQEYRFGDIARLTGSSFQQVAGVVRQCPKFNHYLTETGQPLTPCPGCYKGARQSLLEPEEDYPEGRPTCQYRRAGVLEVLAREGWIAIEKNGSETRGMKCEIQVYRYPPLLTPAQVAAFSTDLKEAHEQFLESEYSVSIPDWQATEVESFMDLWHETAGLKLPLLRLEVSSAFARNNIFLCAD